MSPVTLFIVGLVVFLPVFVASLSFVYAAGVRIDKIDDEAAGDVDELGIVST